MKYTVSDCFGTWLFEDGSNSYGEWRGTFTISM